jgi:hypothetical protein
LDAELKTVVSETRLFMQVTASSCSTDTLNEDDAGLGWRAAVAPFLGNAERAAKFEHGTYTTQDLGKDVQAAAADAGTLIAKLSLLNRSATQAVQASLRTAAASWRDYVGTCSKL